MKHIIKLALAVVFAAALFQSCNSEIRKARAVEKWIASLQTDAEPFDLCERQLTADLVYCGIGVQDINDTFHDEHISPSEVFYYPDNAFSEKPLSQKLMSLQNSAAVWNRIMHCYEAYNRELCSVDDSLLTKADTLAFLAMDPVGFTDEMLREAIPDDKLYLAASALVKAYGNFDGDDSPESEFSQYVYDFREVIGDAEPFADTVLLNEFHENFWKWYEKKTYVPQIDAIVKSRIDEVTLSDEQKEIFRRAVGSAEDIDTRAILALEYAQFNDDALPYLSEIIESGLYTKYLLEVWISWRAHLQSEHFGLSSFSVIPDTYFDKVKAKCMETIAKHVSADDDPYARCLLENFLYCENLHRMASLFGNETFVILCNLQNSMFVQPRLR